MGDNEAELNRKESIRMKKYMLDKAGERENAHRKAFTKWVNSKLAEHAQPCTIQDVVTDLQDGRMLLNLLEVLTKRKLKKEKGSLRVHKINNVERALVVLDECKIKLVGINGFDIVDGKVRVILGLLWSIILRFQVEEVMQQEVNAQSSKSFTIEKRLLEWCRERLDGYDVKITDFSSSWQNGLAFSAILHSYNPEAYDFSEVKESLNTRQRLEHAFREAENEFEVPRILDASDVNVDRPDKKLIILYLSSMYDKLEAARANRSQVVVEPAIVVQRDEEVESALEDSWDQLDAKPQRSREERERADEELTRKLDDLEAAVDDAEYRRPVTEDSDLLELPSCKTHLDRHKKYIRTIDSLHQCAKEVCDEGREVINDGYIDEDREDHYIKRMRVIEDRVQGLQAEGYANKDKVSTVYLILLKQQVNRMNDWVATSEGKIDKTEEIGHDYDTIKGQVEEHQKFQADVSEHSLDNILLEVDNTEPGVDQDTRRQLKALGSRWTRVWNWSEDRKGSLMSALNDWQKFRDEELVLLNWLASKEKALKEINNVDLMEDDEVKKSLDTLQGIQTELEQQEQRLEVLHDYGEQLMIKAKDDKETVNEIEKQLNDFDECWNDIAKQVIVQKEKLTNASKKVAELRNDMKEVTVWMDDAEKMLTDVSADPSEDDLNRLKDKLELKCDERGAIEKQVQGVNRLQSDMQPLLDTSSAQVLEEEVEALNEKWRVTNAALESFSDKGYSDKKTECCLMRIIKRKFKSTNT